jgi:hypothetical protein
LSWKSTIPLVALVAILGSGCSGVNYSHGVAPIDFLIPGGFMRSFMMNERPTLAPPLPEPEIITNQTIAVEIVSLK